MSLLTPAPPASAAAGINPQMNFQGRLLTASGAVVPDGAYNLEFKLYTGGTGCVSSGVSPCGGTNVWTEDWVYGSGAPDNRVILRNGYFSVSLGALSTLTGVDFNNDTLWTSINIGNTTTAASFAVASGDGEMLPFKRLTSSPYSFNAGKLGGLAAASFVQLTPAGQQTGSINVSGNIQTAAALQGATATLSSTGSLTVGTASSASGSIAFKSAGSVNTVTLTVGTTASTYQLTLPTALGASGDCLKDTNGAGVLGFASCGGASGSLQGSYTTSAGATPSIAVNTTNKAVTIQNSITTGIAAGNEYFGVRATGASDVVLGNSLFTVNSTGVGINIGGIGNPATSADLSFGTGADRTINVITQATSNTAGQKLTVISATGNGTGAGGILALQGGTGGSGATGDGGAVTVTGGNAASTSGLGGNVTISGGTKTGSGTGGSVIVKPQASNDSPTAFQVQNAAGTSVLTVDTSNSGNLTVAGVAPASLAGAGTAASNILTVTGPAGGATSGITSQAAGAGSAISLTTGNGGATTGVSGSQTGGAAGAITLQGGSGGAATSGTGGAGANVTINGGNGGSGSVTGGAGGRLTLAGGNVGSGGTPTAGYVLVKNAANSATAFQIQNATNSQIFTVDTSGSQIVLGKPGGSGISGQIQFANAANANMVTIVSGTTTGTYQITLPTAIAGSNQCLQSGTVAGGNIPLTFGACGTSGTFVNLQGSSPGTADTGSINLTGTIISAILKVGDVTNGITLDPATGPDYHGTARPTKRISQSPEFLGAVLRGDGSSNTGTLTTSFDATNFHNYYNWTTNQVTNQDFDVATRFAIPNDYSGLTLSPQLCMYGWSDDLTNGTITANVNDSSNTAITLSSSSFTPGTASTWAETCRTISGTPTLTAGGFITMRVTLQAANTKNTRLGEFRIDYLGKF